jgi:hypothetical protein
MSNDPTEPVQQGDITRAVDVERRRVMVDFSELKELQQITIKQNARQLWIILMAVVVATTFIATRESEWKWFKKNTVKVNEFTSWCTRTEKINRVSGNNWEAATFVQSKDQE